jgi:hypothetical protein
LMLIIAAWFAVMAHPTTDTFEPVSAAGELYDVPKHLSREFARSVGINEDQNFPRAMDPANEQYNWCEDWQPLHNVRWLEKVNNGAAVEWIVIWGNSKGAKPTMQRFYQTALAKWNDLPPWNTFRLALPVDAKRTMKGFRVSKLPLAQSRERLCRKELPLSLRAKVTAPCASASHRVRATLASHHIQATLMSRRKSRVRACGALAGCVARAGHADAAAGHADAAARAHLHAPGEAVRAPCLRSCLR